MRKRLYFAASFADTENRRALAKLVEGMSGGYYEVTSSWLNEPPIKAESEHADWEKRARANEDQLDIDRSDAVVVFTATDSTSGGLHWETGYAVGRGIPVYLVGPKRNVFHYQNHFAGWFETVAEFKAACVHRGIA
jgi:nucleoside 2-deoxyribosyltransferase